MAKRNAKDRYAEIFAAPSPKKKRGAAPAPSVEVDPAAFVEEQVRQITAAVRLMAAPLLPVGEREDVEPAGYPGGGCLRCQETEEPHLHGAKLYVGGKVAF